MSVTEIITKDGIIKYKDERGRFTKRPHHITKKLKQQAINLYTQSNLSQLQIARMLHINRAQLCRWLKEEGILRKRKLRSATIRIPKDQEILAYIAGIFDGEGSIEFKKYRGTDGVTRHRIRIMVSNTSKELMDFLVSNIGGKVTKCKGSKKPVYQWQLTRALDVFIFCKAILPYLIVKRTKVEDALNGMKDELNIVDDTHGVMLSATGRDLIFARQEGFGKRY